MYGYQVVFQHPDCPRKRSVLQIVSRWHHSSVVKLLRAEGIYEDYKDWLLVDFSVVNENQPTPSAKPSSNELPVSRESLRLAA